MTKDFTLPDMNLTLQKGQKVTIPIYRYLVVYMSYVIEVNFSQKTMSRSLTQKMNVNVSSDFAFHRGKFWCLAFPELELTHQKIYISLPYINYRLHIRASKFKNLFQLLLIVEK